MAAHPRPTRHVSASNSATPTRDSPQASTAAPTRRAASASKPPNTAPGASSDGATRTSSTGPGWPLPKSLCGIPTLYAWSLAYGHNLLNPDDRIDPWRVRNLIVWHRPNPPVGALGDKVRPSTSYITVACISDKRWFDLDAERTEHQHPDTRHLRADHKLNGRDDGYRNSPHNPAGAPPLDCWIEGLDSSPLEPYCASQATGRVRTGNHPDQPSLDGDVWTIPTNPYKGAHYATYPPTLPRRLIRLMCPRQVCVVCGEPRRRITSEPTYVNSKTGKPATTLHFNGERRNDGENNWDTARQGDRATTRQAPTLGWTDCNCWEMVHGHNYGYDKSKYPPADTWRRGHVLDPFAGSGTTLQAAAEQGRDATGIDLDPRNEHLIRDRLGLFLEDVT